jgi:hypothetical protein
MVQYSPDKTLSLLHQREALWSLGIDAIQGGMRECNSNVISGYDSSISRFNWIGSPVSVKDPSCFAGEIYFLIPNKMTSYFAPSNRSLHVVLKHLESCSNFGHFLSKSIFPHCVVVASVDFHTSVLVGGLSDSSVDLVSRFRSVYGTHHANAGSSAMLRALANSAVSMGCNSSQRTLSIARRGTQPCR